MKSKLAYAEEKNRLAMKEKESLRNEIDLLYGIRTRRVKNMLKKLNKEMGLFRSELRAKNSKIWEKGQD